MRLIRIKIEGGSNQDPAERGGMVERKSKLNCWEFKKCGRQPQGAKERELGLCPASMEQALDNVHEGTNAGRACWIVGGTFCKGEVQGRFAQKFRNCEKCDFYQLVRKEEGPDFTLSAVLLTKLGK
jgi:hypothetical protein